jgi:hypothetical protein
VTEPSNGSSIPSVYDGMLLQVTITGEAEVIPGEPQDNEE